MADFNKWQANVLNRYSIHATFKLKKIFLNVKLFLYLVEILRDYKIPEYLKQF